ncbi:hypothetical protein BC830DRAFT_1167493 [Chytriomyces sp. MP71]|nr:hypothetical protein BC830DRAFT_1167493 [Chytriomyces sp. MP71]
MIELADKSLGDLAVLHDKNPMKASGYAAIKAYHAKKSVRLVELYDDDPNPPKPWNRFLMNCKTLVLNSVRSFSFLGHPFMLFWDSTGRFDDQQIVSCLAGGRNKMMAVRAYDFLNAKLDGSGFLSASNVTKF